MKKSVVSLILLLVLPVFMSVTAVQACQTSLEIPKEITDIKVVDGQVTILVWVFIY